jgi:hypothetical protein
MHGCVQFCQFWLCVLCICAYCALTCCCYLFRFFQTIEHLTYSCSSFRSCHSSGSWTLMNVLSLTWSCSFFRLCHSSARWTLSSHCEASGSRLGDRIWSWWWTEWPWSKFWSKFLSFSLANCSYAVAPYLHITASWNVLWPQPGSTLLQPWAWEALSLTACGRHQSGEVYCYIIQSFVFVSCACELFC